MRFGINSVARSVIETQRGKHPTHVFAYADHPVTRMNNKGWRTARTRATAKYQESIGTVAPWGFQNLRVHDLRHTVGRRLRALGISQEDREDILGHSGGRMVTHYSTAEIWNLVQALEKITQPPEGQREVTLLRVVNR
jgi:integrase